MQPDHVIPFIEAAKSVFDTMVKMPVRFGKPEACRGGDALNDVSGIISLTGDLRGVVVLTFPTDTAVGCIRAFTGADVDPAGEDFPDAVGEIANMVTGAAKARFDGLSLSIGCPSVVMGAGHTVRQVGDYSGVRIPCTTDAGPFSIDICIRDEPAKAAA